MSERPTMKTIADALGVSIGTVERALKNRGRVHADTRRRVLEEADRLGYRLGSQTTTAPTAPDRLRVVALYPAKDEVFFGEISRGMAAAIRDMNAYPLTLERMHTTRHSLSNQQHMLEKLAARQEEWDALIIAAAHPTALNAAIDSFVEAGKVVVTINSDAVASKRLFFVGQDQYRSGRVAANVMGELLRGEGLLLLLTGFRSVWGHEQRLEGFADVLQKSYPGIRCLGPYEYFDEDFTARELLESALREHPEIEGIYGTSSIALSQAAAVLEMRQEAHQDARRVRVVGFDTDDEIAQYIREGVIDCSLLQDPYAQGFYSLKLLARHVFEGWVPKRSNYYTQMEILLRENAHGNELPVLN